ncbi:MAG: DNRLRE domain-containing protein, partial [Eubacterium sp.]|nr:DNRLRE domain-containing protein [Eubacterium sp.]
KNYSENIKCSLKETGEKGKYIVEMHIDEEYLSSEETQYPVVIDPTNTWQGNSQIRDAYVISGSTYGDTNFYDSGTKKMPVGKNNTGTHRTYLKLYDLYAVTKGCSVTSAKLTVYETGSGQAGQSIGICRVPSSWEPADITNNNRPVGTTLYSSITSKGTEGSSSVFDILTYVKNVASGSITNYGLMLYNKMDNPGIATFYGSRTGDTAKRPKLVVTYYSIPTVATASELKIKEGKQGNKYNKTLYVKNSEDTYFSFSGIISNGLKRVEQRIRYWNDETQTSGSIVKDYGESTTVTNGGSMISLPEGCYINYIRGVNTAGVAGEAKTTGYIHVDKTTPTINSFNLKQTTTESSPTNDKCPEIEWKIADKHFRSVSVIQNGKFVKTGLTPKVGSYKYAEGNTAITKSGKYDIKIRAYDWAGNYKDSAVKSYYVDKTVPTIDSVFLKDNNGNEIGTNYTIESDPIISFNDVTDNNDMTTDCISYAVTKKGAAAPTTYKVPTDISINSSKPYIGSFSLNSEDENLETGEYTIYIRATDKAGNTSAYKTLDYKKDISKPTGSLKVTEQGTVEEVISLKNTANIVVTASGTGSELEKLEMKLFKVNSDGKEIEKHDFGAVSTTDNYDLNTLKYDNGDYRLKLYLEDAVGNTDTVTKDVTIANPLKAPSLTTVPTNDGNAIVNWKVEDISKVAKFQYRVEGSEAWTDVSVSENDNTGSIDVVLPESEGQYKVHVRAVDIHGLEGMSATVKCTFDKTQPTAEITAFESGYLIGNISDDNSVEWTLSVKESSESDSEYTELKAGTEKISSGKIAFIDFNGEQYVIGKTYNVKLTAKDTAGNISTTIYNITKTTGIYETKLEAELDVAHLKHQAAEENKIIYPTDITQISLSNLDDIEGTVTWYVDNVKKTTGTVYEDDFSTDKENSVYEEHTEYPVLVINKKPDGTRTYSRDILCNVIKNVTFDETSLEDVVDLNGSKVVSFRIMDSSSGSSYFVKTDNKEFKTVSTGETVYIADLFENVAYAENITVKASLQNEDVSIQLDIIESDNIETFELSNIENYRPEDITVADKINYKTYIKWQNEINEDTPDNIYYEVYRGTEDDFVPGPDTLAATNVRAGYFSEVNINFSEGFYYKIRAVEKTENGKYFSSFSEQIYSKVIDSDEYTKRMGVKEYWEFADIETPNGDISVEKSMGNMVYQQTDAMLPNEGLEVELTRTYNSQSSAKSAFGVGWTHDYDIELLRICKDGDINDANFVMKDGSGTIYHFVKNDDGVYTSSLGKYVNLKKEEISEDVKIPARIVGVAGSGDEKKTITVNSSYTMSTKDNIEYRFNSGGQLVYMEEANGNFMIFEYEPEKRTYPKSSYQQKSCYGIHI